jgi:hypothetical protein
MKRHLFIFITHFFLLSAYAISPSKNPFLLSFDDNLELSHDRYLDLQNKLNDLDLVDFLTNIYQKEKSKNPKWTNLHTFLSRNLRAAKAIVIDENKQLLPKKELIAINGGGNLCIVCSIPFRANYVEMLNEQIEALKSTGFQGYHLSFFGGYPNPTGEEFKFAAVPYAFKIFAIREAVLLGFEKVAWLDAACIPQKNLQFLENLLDQAAAIYTHLPPRGFENIFKNARLPEQTRLVLKTALNVDPQEVNYVVAAMMAFNTSDSLFKDLIEDYYHLVRLGTPFISLNPEEYVLSTIIGQEKYKKWYEINDKLKMFAWDNPLLLRSEERLFTYRHHFQAMAKIW